MPLPLEHTTRLTEAMENAAKEYAEVVTDITQVAEELVSRATRADGSEATALDFMADATRLAVAWLNGASRLATTAVDNLVLITDPTEQQWISDDFELAEKPKGKQRWLLRIDEAVDQGGRKLIEGGVKLVDGEIRLFAGDPPVVISTNSPSPTPVDRTWDRTFRARPRITGYIPGALTLKVTALDAETGAVVYQPIRRTGLVHRDLRLVGT